MFFRLYLDALDEELLAPLTSTSGHKLTTAALGVEEREVSGQADAENQDFMVRQLFCGELGIADRRMAMSRSSHSSRP